MQTQPWNLFLDLHIFSSSRLVPLPHCQRYALASSPASLSFAWLHLNPLTHLNGPLWWRARWRRSCLAFAPLETAWKQPDSSLKAAFTWSTSRHTYQCGSRGASEGALQPPSLSLQFSFPLRKLGKDICTHAVRWFSAHARSAKENGDTHILTYILVLIGGALAFWYRLSGETVGVVHYFTSCH